MKFGINNASKISFWVVVVSHERKPSLDLVYFAASTATCLQVGWDKFGPRTSDVAIGILLAAAVLFKCSHV